MQRLLALMALAVLVWLSIYSSLSAQTLTQGYRADVPVQKGMIVRLKEDDASKVEPLPSDQMEDMHGVVVNSNDAAVTLSTEERKVFVATTGHYEVLVSNQNGDIKVGDYITLSALTGVGMRAGSTEPLVIGHALAVFDSNSQVAGEATVKDSAGGERTVRLGRIAVNITIARNPFLRAAESNLPYFLQKASQAIAGKPVDASRAYLGLVVFLVTTAITGSLLYGGVRSGIISVGRNPLSKNLIVRSMLQVILAGLIIFIIGLFGVYLLLKL